MAQPGQDAERCRIRALAHLVKGDLGQARLEIARAAGLRPEWESIRLAAAMINYYSALSPAALPTRLLGCPLPVDWDLLKRDETSVLQLRKAADGFRRLAETEINRERQRLLEAWLLACLASDSEKVQEAEDFCKSLLAKDPV